MTGSRSSAYFFGRRVRFSVRILPCTERMFSRDPAQVLDVEPEQDQGPHSAVD